MSSLAMPPLLSLIGILLLAAVVVMTIQVIRNWKKE